MKPINYTEVWREATGELDGGLQRLMIDTLNAVAEGTLRMAYGADVREGVPCLVNAIRPLIDIQADNVPSIYLPRVVSAFDQINAKFHHAGLPTDYLVQPQVARYLVENFSYPLNPVPEIEPYTEFLTLNDECVIPDPDTDNCVQSWLANALIEGERNGSA